MKRFIAAAAVAALMFVPSFAGADDIEDGADCRSGSAEPVALGAANGEDADRGSFCVHANGTTVLYVGGEAQSETDPGTGGACGAIIVADQTLSGTDDWDNGTDHCN